MAMASADYALFSPSDILIGEDDVPIDAVLSTYAIGKLGRRPLNDEERTAFRNFYDSLIGHKYKIPEKFEGKLPLSGMLVAAVHIGRWHPAVVMSEIYRSRSGYPTCDLVLTETKTPVPGFRVGQSMAFLSGRFLNLFPTRLVEDPKPSKIVRLTKDRHSSDDEDIDYMSFLPLDAIVEFNFKFQEEPLLKPVLDQRRSAADAAVGDYFSVAKTKLMITHVESPSDFVFTDLRFQERKEIMYDRMSHLYSLDETDVYLVPVELVQPGLPVVVITGMNSWARAYVGEIVDKDICVVRLVDGGGSRQVYKRLLRFVHKSLAEFPTFSYRGKLAGVLPMYGGTWSEQATRVFSELAAVNLNFILGVVSYFMADGTVALFLWNKGKNNEDVWIGDEMMRRLLAREDNTPPEWQPSRALPEKDEQAALLAELLSKASIYEGSEADGKATTSSAAAGGQRKIAPGGRQGWLASRAVQR